MLAKRENSMVLEGRCGSSLLTQCAADLHYRLQWFHTLISQRPYRPEAVKVKIFCRASTLESRISYSLCYGWASASMLYFSQWRVID